MSSDWSALFAQQLRRRHSREVQPFSVIESYVKVREQLIAASNELQALKADRDRLVDALRHREEEAVGLRLAAQGLTLHSVKEKELEDRLQAMTNQLTAALEQTNRMLKVEHDLLEKSRQVEALQHGKAAVETRCRDAETELAKQTQICTLLKRELESLRAENEMQRQQFAKAREENDRLIPQLLMSKQREAELQNIVGELEQQLIDSKGDKDVSSKSACNPRDGANESVVELEAPSAMCVIPTYIANSIDDAHAGDIHAVTITETGRTIWTGGADKVLKGWETASCSSVGKITTPASALCLDARSSFLIAGCVDCTCRVWHSPTLRSHCQLTGHTEAVNAAYMTYDAQRIFTASRDCTIKSWDLQRSALQFTSVCAVACYDLSVGIDRVCTAHFDNSIRLWDIRTGKGAGEVRDLHTKAVTSVRLTPDNQYSVSLSRDNTIKLVDLRMLKEVRQFSDARFTIASNLVRLALSPDGTYCAAGAQSGSIAVFNIRDNSVSSATRMLGKGHTAAVMSLCWSPDGRGMASVSLDKRVVFWR